MSLDEPANSEPIVEAYLRALAAQEATLSERQFDEAERHFACAAFAGIEQQVLSRAIFGPRHAALAAIVVGERLNLLIEQYGENNQISVDTEFRALIDRLAKAMRHLWQYLARQDGGNLAPHRPCAQVPDA